jgi:hypothetical protein
MLTVTTQLTLDLPLSACDAQAGDNCVKHARVQKHTARVFLVLEQIKGNLGSYGGFCIGGLSSYS